MDNQAWPNPADRRFVVVVSRGWARGFRWDNLEVLLDGMSDAWLVLGRPSYREMAREGAAMSRGAASRSWGVIRVPSRLFSLLCMDVRQSIYSHQGAHSMSTGALHHPLRLSRLDQAVGGWFGWGDISDAGVPSLVPWIDNAVGCAQSRVCYPSLYQVGSALGSSTGRHLDKSVSRC